MNIHNIIGALLSILEYFTTDKVLTFQEYAVTKKRLTQGEGNLILNTESLLLFIGIMIQKKFI